MRVTGSKVHRVWKCPASAVLPQSGTYRPDLEPARGRGQAIHGFLEVVKRVGRAAALAEAPTDLVPLLEALDLDNLPTGLATEVSFAYNWREVTARELGRNLPRRPDGGVDYDAVGNHGWDGPEGMIDWSCEVPCTIDVVGVAKLVSPGHEKYPPTRGYVGDYKSGHTKYPAPDMYGQTLLAALCVQLVYGCDDVVVELIHIHDNGGHHSVRRTVNEWDLMAFADQLGEAMAEVEEALPTYGIPGDLSALPGSPVRVVEGPWCDYCDAYKDCPKKVALVKAIPQELVQLGIRPDRESGELQLTPGALTVRNAGVAWMAIERIEDALCRAKAEICGIASFEEVPLSDGRVIGREVTEKRVVNGRIAAEILEKRYGREERDKRVVLKVTLEALYKAAVAHKKEGEKLETRAKDGAVDRLVAEVEQAGGIEVKVTEAVKPHVPKKKRLPG